MTRRPWQVWSHPLHRWPRIVATYATRARAQAEADRCNAIAAAQPNPTYFGRYTVKRRRP